MELAEMIVDAFFDAEFEGGRHERRVNLIRRIEQDYARGKSGKEEDPLLSRQEEVAG